MCLVLIERQQDERLGTVETRVREQGQEPIFQKGRRVVDQRVVPVIDLRSAWLKRINAPNNITSIADARYSA